MTPAVAIAAFLLLLAGAPASAAKKPGKLARKTFERAASLCRKGDFDASLDLFDKALELHDGWKTVLAFRAQCLLTSGDPEGAAEDARAGSGLKPNNAESFTARGKSRFVLKDLAGAAKDFRRALSMDQDLAEAHYGWAGVQISRGEVPGALESLGHAVSLEPAFALAYLLRGAAHDRAKDYNAAVVDYGRALEINPGLLVARYYRGKTYRQTKQYPQALEDLDAYLESFPEFEEGYYLRSNVRFITADYKGTLADLNRVLSLNPKRGLAYSNRGQAKAQIGDREGALKDLKRALELEPTKREQIQAAIDRVTKSKPKAKAETTFVEPPAEEPVDSARPAPEDKSAIVVEPVTDGENPASRRSAPVANTSPEGAGDGGPAGQGAASEFAPQAGERNSSREEAFFIQ